MSLTLGELIDALKKVPGDRVIRIAAPSPLEPTDVGSYRGYYEDLAIDFEPNHGTKTVAEFLPVLEAAVGETFTGYKGGEFKMTRGTRVWVSGYGYASGALVRSVDSDRHTCWLEIEMEHW